MSAMRLSIVCWGLGLWQCRFAFGAVVHSLVSWTLSLRVQGRIAEGFAVSQGVAGRLGVSEVFNGLLFRDSHYKYNLVSQSLYL